MKTLLNICLLLSLTWLLPGTLAAQTEQTYAYWRQEGLNRHGEQDFEGAIRAYRLALAMDDTPARNDIDKLINESFQGYVELLKASNERTRLEALAFRLSKDNPTDALRIAEHVVDTYGDVGSSRELLNEIIGSYPPAFYAAVMRHEQMIESVAFAPDGQAIATACWDGNAYLWSPQGEQLAKMEGHEDKLTDICFSPDGNWILTGARDNTARLWNRDGELLQTMTGHDGDVTTVAFSPDSRTIATAGWDRHIRLWNLKGQPIRSWEAHDDFIASIAFAPDGQSLISGGWDDKARQWSLTGDLLLEIDGHDQSVASVCFSPDGANILTGSWDATARVWDLEGNEVQIFAAHTAPVTCARFSPDGRYVLTSSIDMTSRLWSIHGNELQTYRYHNAMVRHVDFSNDGLSFVSGSYDRDVVLWNFTGTQTQNIDQEAFGAIMDLELSPDGKEMLIGTSENKAYLLDKKGMIILTLADHNDAVESVAFSPDGSLLLTGSRDDYLRVWDRSGKNLGTFFHEADVLAVACTADGKGFFSGGWGDYGILWDIDGNMVDTFKIESRVYDACFSPDGQQLLVGLRNGTVQRWSLEGELLQTLQHSGSDVKGVAFSPDGQYIAAVGKNQRGVIWNSEGKPVSQLRGHTEIVYDITFSEDGEFLVTAGGDATAKLWNLQGQNLQTFTGHRGPVFAATFTPDRRVMTAGADHSVRSWMVWDNFLQSDRLAALPDWKKLEYGIITDSTGIEIPDPFNERTYQTLISVIEYIEMKTEKEKDPNLNYQSGFYFSQLAHQSGNLTEKLDLQKRAVDNVVAAFAQRETVGPSSQDVLAYLYGELALWQLAARDNAGAQSTIEKGLAVEAQDHIKDLISGKAALVALYNGQLTEAQEQIAPVKDTEINKPDSRFWQLHALITDQRIERDAVVLVADRVLADLEYLNAAGVTAPEGEAFKGLLMKRP